MKLGCRRQTAWRISANTMAWLTSWKNKVKVIESGTIRQIGYGFLLVFCVNFCPYDAPFFRYPNCNYTVTLKPGLGSFKVIETDTYRWAPSLTSYWRSIAIMGLSRTVSEINEDFGGISQNWQSSSSWFITPQGSTENTTTFIGIRCACACAAPCGGCKIITYLESKTASFLLTAQLSSGYDDD